MAQSVLSWNNPLRNLSRKYVTQDKTMD